MPRLLPLCVAAISSLCLALSAADRPPNILMIVSDDHTWFDYGFMGSKAVSTPHLDKLAAESRLFPRGYVTNSLCGPSLASMLTGRHVHRHGITGNDPRMPAVEGVKGAGKAAAAIKAFCKEQGLATPPPAQQKLAITISALPEETTTVIIEARVEGLGGAETASSGTLGLG